MTATNTRATIALLHGWGFDARVWDPVAPLLAPAADVIRLDLPGYRGAPDCGDLDATIAQLASQLPANTVLVGWSLGALLAQKIAAAAPDRVARLVLVAGTPCFAQRDDWAFAQPNATLSAFIAGIDADPAATLVRFAALINQRDACARALVRGLAPLLQSPLPDTRVLLRGLHWLRDLDLRDPAGAIAQRCLLIHGAHDPLMPVAASQWLAQQLPNAELEVFEAAAHMPFASDPERFAQRIQQFVGEAR